MMLLLHSSLPALNTSTPYLFSQDVAHKYCNEKMVHLVDSITMHQYTSLLV